MVFVDDRIMGSGKTHDAMRYIEANSSYKFLYVTPFLSEVERIISDCSVTFRQPSNKNKQGSKLLGLRDLIENGSNIVTTHALFHSLTKQDYAMFSEYHLILDEVTTPIEMEVVSKKDTELLFNNKTISVDDSGFVSWNDETYLEGKFLSFKEKVQTNNVLYVDDMFFIWSFPIEIFKSFKSTKILTYIFNGSILKYYFDYNNIEYTVNTVDDKEKKDKIRKLLNIYNGMSNRVGEERTALSLNWYRNVDSRKKKSIANSMRNVIKYFGGTRSAYVAYTTFKEFKDDVASNGYKNGFIPVNSRSTNEFNYKILMMYCANRFINPALVKVFQKRNIEIDQEQYALAEMIQWIWRGCIRDGKPMDLYIPSKRMRELLLKWLNN
jgi:hypothetical protein